MQKIIAIEGMSCNSCANSIEKKISQLNGVQSVNINFAAKQLTVEFEAQQISEQNIKQAIIDMGYEIIN